MRGSTFIEYINFFFFLFIVILIYFFNYDILTAGRYITSSHMYLLLLMFLNLVCFDLMFQSLKENHLMKDRHVEKSTIKPNTKSLIFLTHLKMTYSHSYIYIYIESLMSCHLLLNLLHELANMILCEALPSII